MPPKGVSTRLNPVRLQSIPHLRVRRPNTNEPNTCVAVMSSMLSEYYNYSKEFRCGSENMANMKELIRLLGFPGLHPRGMRDSRTTIEILHGCSCTFPFPCF